ncbi:MAG: hypothetical protein IPL25_20230 [Saprospiraceae bacterium]|nr:hypothetical protein [Candidatus Vicinibacter affinis]
MALALAVEHILIAASQGPTVQETVGGAINKFNILDKFIFSPLRVCERIINAPINNDPFSFDRKTGGIGFSNDLVKIFLGDHAAICIDYPWRTKCINRCLTAINFNDVGWITKRVLPD